MNLHQLIESINQTADYFQREALRQVNSHLTLRNWVIGLYLFEYEQKGQDRAQYGERLYPEIVKRLKHLKGMSKTQLYRFKDFYLNYPQIFPTVSGKLQKVDSQRFVNYLIEPSTLTKLDNNLPYNDPQLLIERLSFSHFLELLDVDTPIQRIFYEVETIKNNWDVRDLRRAIETSLYERTGLSTDKAAVIEKIKSGKQLLPYVRKKMKALCVMQWAIYHNRFSYPNTYLICPMKCNLKPLSKESKPNSFNFYFLKVPKAMKTACFPSF
jgi:DUF1016 N-terminal domain